MHAAVQHVAAISGQIIGYLKDLVRMQTVHPPGDHYEDLCLYTMERMRRMDCDVDLVHVPQTYENDLYPFGKGYPRMRLVGCYRKSRNERPGLHMSGHYDVGPAGVTWRRDPFQSEEEDGRLYGLGTSDMIRELGIPSLTYGPGTTGTAPTPNEYMVIEDLTKTKQVLVQVALTLLS
jgi:acetylornithine deacetylase/succinyl-diaminopimelate desuccinylase-like protein